MGWAAQRSLQYVGAGPPSRTSQRITTTTTQAAKITTLSELLNTKISAAEGWPQLRCRLDPGHVDAAAVLLAEGIAHRRIGTNARLHAQWQSRQREPSGDPLDSRDRRLLEAGLLQNIGTPAQAGPTKQLHGLVAEAVWFEVASEVDAGLGVPVRVEGHDWSVTDPGGDGLTVYTTADAGFCFRLWESKHHGTSRKVRRTVNRACRQMKSRSLSYLSRFSLIAQQITDDETLGRFYGELAEHWVNADPAAGVGISVGTDSDANVYRCFGKVATYFEFELDQHQAQLHLMADFSGLASRVREEIWKGCGLWTEP